MPTTPKEGEAGKQAALDALRAALMAGDVVPGQRLVEAELADTFGVTRASMRAALIDLTADGLVERIPHRGARVRVVSIEEAVAITECRMVLEGLCAAKAAEKVTDDQIGSLRELAVRLQAAVDDGESMKYSELNRELHRAVREIAGQPVAAELLERLHAQIVRHQFRLAMRAGRPHVSLPEHLAIIDAIARRDPDAAEQAARAHLRSVITALRDTEN
ncbi:GntR family transcriptional regulator [Amycolatopsis sp. FDAARGOS 1241]|uniref:GntR family transcriptional regulator n=1 Tax=Amycolatopsis sp. FDAARGOS 1241 TaxID=2778070 RepID=UPI00194EF228|nr:GntR family transcriptional regulator [Amycolatopsis sp. FDAARGOS 1241]QRP49755.1 GntR family transcriptional regulator [Amycolatopsis sp. FDAARGOS 1241]